MKQNITQDQLNELTADQLTTVAANFNPQSRIDRGDETVIPEDFTQPNMMAFLSQNKILSVNFSDGAWSVGIGWGDGTDQGRSSGNGNFWQTVNVDLTDCLWDTFKHALTI